MLNVTYKKMGHMTKVCRMKENNIEFKCGNETNSDKAHNVEDVEEEGSIYKISETI